MKPLPHFSNSEIEALRPDSLRPSPSEHPHATSWEQEATSATGGDLADVLTVMLLGSECQFRCLMCDLWKTTHRGPTPSGSIPKQLHNALRGTNGNPAGVTKPRERWIKLYNASNFFAPYNVPVNDLDLIAREIVAFQRIVVENHPRLLRESIVRFRDALHGRLEVALGLETVHPETLAALNKRMDADDFQAACQWLLSRDIDVRSFVLLKPPGMDEEEGIFWCERSVRFAESQGVRHVSIIPMRSGNGAVDVLQQRQLFEPPLARSLESALNAALSPNIVVTADLWDWHKLRGLCPKCSSQRLAAIQLANLRQHAINSDSSFLPACPCRS
ncbi:MAG: radical SAM protein [Planctomycetales bacterium]|nr:radical SAM protein [Planctomycetales bacterium]